MEFVELTISPTKRYTYKTASNLEMNILGDFLASDVGYRPALFKKWASDNTSQNANGNLTALEKDNNYIILTDIFAKEETSTTLKMSCQQYIKILDDWETQVCKIQPKEIIIKHENNDFSIETVVNENNNEIAQSQTMPHADYTIKPHSYPLWIKLSFMICCVLLFICLLDFPYYFKLSEQVKKAHRAFENKNYTDAAIYFQELSKELPDNKYMKRYLAQSLFKSDKIEDHMLALNSLAKVELKKREWQELLNYMPGEYVSFFQDAKKG